MSGQDGDVGRHTMLPRTTKRRTTNLETKINQNCQKIKLYGSPTTKEIKKKHSSRPVGETEMGSRAERTCGKAVAGGQRVPHLRADKRGGATGEQDRPCNPGLHCGEIKPQISDWKHLWVLRRQWERLPASQTVHWRDPQGPRMYTSPPTRKSAPEGPSLLVGSGGSDWNPAESKASGTVLSWTPPQKTASQGSHVGYPALANT